MRVDTRKQSAPSFGSRLKAARKMAGLSLEDLSNRLGNSVSRQAIYKYEKGLVLPDSEMILRLSKELGVNIDYFFRKPGSNFDGFSFRKKSNLPRKKEESIKQRAIDFLERYQELEDLLNISIKFENPLRGCSFSKREDIERAVEKLRADWGLGVGPLFNLLETIEKKGIKIFEVEESTSFDGLSGAINGNFLIVINKDCSLDRKRFTAAHELGHILCRFSQQEDSSCQAFAAALLLPRKALFNELKQKNAMRHKVSYWEWSELKRTYGISIQAIVRRACDLNIISQSYYRIFNIEINRLGWRSREPVEYEGKEESARFKHLLNYALAEHVISFSKAAHLANMRVEQFRQDFQSGL